LIAVTALLAGVMSLLTVGAAAAASGWKQVKEINGGSGNLIGWSVATYGDTMVLGAPSDNSGIGAVYVYTGSGRTWTQEAELTPTGGASGDFFGGAVAIDSGNIVVGAWSHNGDEGDAYVFAYSGSGATFIAKQKAVLTDPGLASNDTFGYTLAVSGSSIEIGAPGENSNAGAVYVYTGSGKVWTLEATLADPGATPNDSFGYDLALSSATMVVGAIGAAGSGTGAFTGAAYVFNQIAGGFAQEAKLTASNGEGCATTCSQPYGLIGGDYFGYSVAIDATTIAVGAPFASVPPAADGVGTGTVYAFGGSGSSWTQKQELDDPLEVTAGGQDWFGYNVAFLGDNSIVSNAPYDSKGNGTGASFVFSPIGNKWGTYPTELTASDAATGDYFGYCLTTIGNNFVLVGAPYAPNGGLYFFKD
jgi:hypothetical protein